MSEGYVGIMDDMCKLLSPQLSMGPVCINWFRDATEHCLKVLFEPKTWYNMFWQTIKQYIYPVVQKHILPQAPVPLHPQLLSANQCTVLISDIMRQYTRQAPFFAATTTINNLLWEVIYHIGHVLILIILIFSLCYVICGKEKKPQGRPNSGSPRSQLKQQMPVARTTQDTQVPCHVNQMLRPENVLAPDGSPVLVLRMSSKLKVLNRIVVRSQYTLDQLFCRQDNAMLQPNDYKAETIQEIMKFIDKKFYKMGVLICFEGDDPMLQTVESQLKPAVKSAPKSKPQLGAIAPKSVSGLVLNPKRSPAPFKMYRRTVDLYPKLAPWGRSKIPLRVRRPTESTGAAFGSNENCGKNTSNSLPQKHKQKPAAKRNALEEIN